MADQRTLVAGQVVSVDVPSSVRSLLPVSSFTVTAVDQAGVHLQANGAFGDGLALGTPVVVSAVHAHWPIEGLVAQINAPSELVVVLEAVPERRQYDRVEFAIEGELQLIDHPGSFPSRFTTVDVSEGGVCLRLTSQVNRGDRGFVSLEVGGSPVLAIGEILDCSTVNMYFEARLRFTSIAESSRQRLARMVAQANEALNASA
jgi:PilZ domain